MARTLTMQRAPGTRASYSAAPSTAGLDNLANLLDSRFSIFGIRFGIDPILGLLPGVGDLASFGVSTYLIAQGYRMGARKRVVARMLGNAAAEAVVGSIPLVGNVVSVFWRANKSNMKMLKRELSRPGVLRRG